MEGNSIQLDNQEIQYIYTLYMITPLKDTKNSATYTQNFKYYTKGDMYYKVNKILKKKYEENKNYDRNQLNYFEQDSFRDIQLEKEFVPKSVEEIISLYKDNNPLFYSNEKLYNYYDTVNDFFITMSYIDNNN